MAARIQLSRPRRNRSTESIRSLVRETRLSVENLVMPLFVVEGEGQSQSIPTMPGQYRYSIDTLLGICERCLAAGIPAVALFPCLENTLKDPRATESWNENGLYCRAIAAVKQRFPELTVLSDVAMDPYSSEGHDGLLDAAGNILNDETLPILGKMALAQACAGADILAPSDMMDGRVGYLRETLEQAGYAHKGILSYAVKYASHFYGPFRKALNSAPRQGDKKSYQMDPANAREALREALLDASEGADILMIKPGLPYLDIVRTISLEIPLPVAVYQVSGEYAMLRAAAETGALEYRGAVLETLLAFRRAGASMILTYHALEAAAWLKETPS